MSKTPKAFVPLTVAVMTVSDRRDASQDSSGDYLAQAARTAGHRVAVQQICTDNRYQIRAVVSTWIASPDIQVILINGGTGFSAANSTPEALEPLFDRTINGFGELFRMVSYEEIGGATLQSRALAGLANQTLIFAMPGSTSACQQAWERIICPQIDATTRPCNFVSQLKTL